MDSNHWTQPNRGVFQAHEYVEFRKAGVNDNAIQFVETDNIDVAEFLFPNINHGTNNFIGLVKNEAEKFLAFGEFSSFDVVFLSVKFWKLIKHFILADETFEEEKILKFVDLNKYPLISTMTELNSANIYASAIKLQVTIS